MFTVCPISWVMCSSQECACWPSLQQALLQPLCRYQRTGCWKVEAEPHGPLLFLAANMAGLRQAASKQSGVKA